MNHERIEAWIAQTKSPHSRSPPFAPGIKPDAMGNILNPSSPPHSDVYLIDDLDRTPRNGHPHGVITNKQIESHKREDIKYTATRSAYNGSAWECYICHKEFGAVNALSSHLNSPAHNEKVYHCPNTKSRCGKQFVSLAGFFNHLESETCGFMRFAKVQRRVGDVLQGRKLIAFS